MAWPASPPDGVTCALHSLRPRHVQGLPESSSMNMAHAARRSLRRAAAAHPTTAPHKGWVGRQGLSDLSQCSRRKGRRHVAHTSATVRWAATHVNSMARGRGRGGGACAVLPLDIMCSVACAGKAALSDSLSLCLRRVGRAVRSLHPPAPQRRLGHPSARRAKRRPRSARA